MLSSLATTFAEANRYFNTELSAHFSCLLYTSDAADE